MKKNITLMILCLFVTSASFAYDTETIREDELLLDCKTANNPLFGNRFKYVLGIDWLGQNSANGIQMRARPIVFNASEPYAVTGLWHVSSNYSIDIEMADLSQVPVGGRVELFAQFPKFLTGKMKRSKMNCVLKRFQIPENLFESIQE